MIHIAILKHNILYKPYSMDVFHNPYVDKSKIIKLPKITQYLVITNNCSCLL